MMYGRAQLDFIRSTRASIDEHGCHFFDDKDWRNLSVKGGRHVGLNGPLLHTSSFYVKSLASWVPHLLIPGFVPSCPKCGHSKKVDPTKSTWIPNPKTLFGIRGHRYLDTKLYPCKECQKSFTGYNLKSMQIDSHKIIGFFNFNISKHFALDDDLYNEIVNSGDEPTASLQRRLEQNVKDQYFSDYQYFLFAVKIQRIRVIPQDRSVIDLQQPTLEKHLRPILKQTQEERELKRLKQQMDNKVWALGCAEKRIADDIDFNKLLLKKKNRNGRDQLLPGLGEKKLRQLIQLGVTNGRLLLEFDDQDNFFVDQKNRTPLPAWKELVIKEFDQRSKFLELARSQKTVAENAYFVLRNKNQETKKSLRI
jgi:hypothetical protein